MVIRDFRDRVDAVLSDEFKINRGKLASCIPEIMRVFDTFYHNASDRVFFQSKLNANTPASIIVHLFFECLGSIEAVKFAEMIQD